MYFSENLRLECHLFKKECVEKFVTLFFNFIEAIYHLFLGCILFLIEIPFNFRLI